MRTDLLREALEYITANPHVHLQDTWVTWFPEHRAQDRARHFDQPVEACGTAYCLAGAIVVLNDGLESIRWQTLRDGEKLGVESTEGGPFDVRAARIVDVNLADIESLFDERNELPALWGQARALAEYYGEEL